MHKREGEIHVDMECLRWGEGGRLFWLRGSTCMLFGMDTSQHFQYCHPLPAVDTSPNYYTYMYLKGHDLLEFLSSALQ